MTRSILVGAIVCVAAANAQAYRPEGEVVSGIGFGDFNQDLGRVTDTGFAWNFRAGVNIKRYLGAEIAYQGLGSDTTTNAVGRGFPATSAVQNAFSGDVKLMAPVQVGRDQLFAGYVFGGAGYSHIGYSDAFFNVHVDSDNAFMAPFGGGLEYAIGNGLLLDARFTYNLLTGSRSNFVRSGDSWNMGFNVGAMWGRY